jgi:uncharacterized repeat protein (TIGR01451 family)
LDSDSTCNLGATGDLPGEDPLLEALADNGGETWTHALGAGSPAIDAIPREICSEDEDQRGVSRPQGLGCDVGAYEHGQVTIWVTKEVDEDNPEPGDYITFTITVENTGLVGASSGTLSDTLPTGMSLAGLVELDPPTAGTLGPLPEVVTGVKLPPDTSMVVTIPVLIDGDIALGTVTNTASFTHSTASEYAYGWVRIALAEYVYLPLVLRNY